MSVEVSYAYEGATDEAVARRLIEFVGATPGEGHGGRGKSHLLTRLKGYNAAAVHSAWLVLVDLDKPKVLEDCVVTFAKRHLPNPNRKLCFRVAVREIEAWLLADRDRFASYFAVPKQRIPMLPENVDDPKATVIDLARRSRSKDIRSDIVPVDRNLQAVGPGYAARFIDFVSNGHQGWRPDAAAAASDSLRRCIGCLRRLVALG